MEVTFLPGTELHPPNIISQIRIFISRFINHREGFYNIPVGLGYVVPISRIVSLYMIVQYDLLFDVVRPMGFTPVRGF